MTVNRRAAIKGVVAGGALAAVPGWVGGVASAGGTAAERPETIPALREWTPAAGGFRLGSPARIVLAPGHADALQGDAAVFAQDLRALLGVSVRVVVRSGPAKAGEVALRLGAADAKLGSEGYRLDIGSAAVVTANKSAGVFYGTRSLLQLLPRGFSVPAGRARDWPRYAERGLFLDNGRKHLTYDWIVDRIHEMSFLKLNYLQLHFTDDQGWRIQSDRTPPVHSTPHLTKSQVRALVKLAAQHHITVVPEIDMPGHMTTALANYPQFQLKNFLGLPNAAKLDYTIPAARQFARELIEEYLPLFPGPYWHTGADEFLPPVEWFLYPHLESYAKQRHGANANAKDGLIGFVNDINDLVRGHGKRLRAYHDGLNGGNVLTLDANVDVEWWTDVTPLGDVQLPTPQELLDRGHRIQNMGWYPTYYSNLPPYYPVPHPDLKGMYETWAVHRFHGVLFLNGDLGTPYHDIDPAEPRNRGSKLSVFNDDPEKETEQQIAAGIRPRLRVMAQQTWESPKLVPTYAEFAPIIDRVGAPPR